MMNFELTRGDSRCVSMALTTVICSLIREQEDPNTTADRREVVERSIEMYKRVRAKIRDQRKAQE